MRRIREVLRLKHELRRSHREIARSLGIANSTVSDYARRASAAGLSWPLPEGLDDAALQAALFPPPPPAAPKYSRSAGPGELLTLIDMDHYVEGTFDPDSEWVVARACELHDHIVETFHEHVVTGEAIEEWK